VHETVVDSAVTKITSGAERRLIPLDSTALGLGGSMLLVATAEVYGNATTKALALDLPPYKLELEADEEGFWSHLVVRKRIDQWRDALPQPLLVHRGTPPPSASVAPLGEDSERTTNVHMNDVRDLLQHLESVCGYLFDVEFIDWRCPTWEWVAESEEERRCLPWIKDDVHRTFCARPRQVDVGLLATAVTRRNELERLDIPLSFFREGKADYREGRFIHSFFSFYFFIEGLYAEGKSDEEKVLEKYLAASELVIATEAALRWLDSMTDPDGGRHALNLRVFLAEQGFEWSVGGMLHLLVRMRNLLHHYSHKSRGVRRGHPLNQTEYESLALLTMTVCLKCLAPVLNGPDAELPPWKSAGKMTLPVTSRARLVYHEDEL
jgi:hypothetical protein